MTPVRRLWLLSLPALLACGGSGNDDQGPQPIIEGDKVSLEIGPEGGTLISKDGQAKLVVPPNALATKTLLSVEPKTIEGTPGYEYQPDGLRFAIRANLTLPVEVGLRDQDPLITKLFDDGYFRHHATEFSADRSSGTAAIPGFSDYAFKPTRIKTPSVTASFANFIKLDFTWGADVRDGIRAPIVRIERARTNGAPAEGDFMTVHENWPIEVDFTEPFVGVGTGVSYHYRVAGLIQAGEGPLSAIATVADPGGGPPGAPTGFRGTLRSTTEVDLSWNGDPAASGFELERGVGGAFVPIASLPAAASTYADAGLTPDTDYEYRLRAIRSGTPSPWATATVSTRQSWRPLGGPMNRDLSRQASRPALGVDQRGTIYAAWAESNETSGGVFVAQWDGASWSPVGGGLEHTAGSPDVVRAHLVVDSADRPVVGWIEAGDVYVKRWNGTTWDDLGGNAISGTPGTDFAQDMALAVAPDGTVLLAISQGTSGGFAQEIHVRKSAPGRWETMGVLSSQTGMVAATPDIVVDTLGRPVVAWQQDSKGPSTIVVSAYNGTGFDNLGGVASDEALGQASFPSLTIDGNGAPVVAFTQNSGHNILTVRRFVGAAWSDLAAANVSGDKSAYTPHLMLGPDRKLVVAFAEDGAGFPQTMIFVRRLETNGWTTVGQAVVDSPAYLRAPSLIAPAQASLVVSWEATSPDGSTTAAHTSAFGL
jgi:hypothetical protein